MRVIVQGDDESEMLSFGVAKDDVESVMCLFPNTEERGVVIAALAEAITFLSPPLRDPGPVTVTIVDGRSRPKLKIVE